MSVVDKIQKAWNNNSKLTDGYAMFVLSKVDVPNLNVILRTNFLEIV